MFWRDSGDGCRSRQPVHHTAALFGNDLATFPDFPAEIPLPAGTLPGVSGFQVNISSLDVYTPGDLVDVLVAMNPAALATNIADLKTNGILIVNTDNFKDVDLKKAQAKTNPLEDHSLDGYRLFKVDLTRLTRFPTTRPRRPSRTVKNFSPWACATGSTTVDVRHLQVAGRQFAEAGAGEANKLP